MRAFDTMQPLMRRGVLTRRGLITGVSVSALAAPSITWRSKKVSLALLADTSASLSPDDRQKEKALLDDANIGSLAIAIMPGSPPLQMKYLDGVIAASEGSDKPVCVAESVVRHYA